jgi:hypothetical protein
MAHITSSVQLPSASKVWRISASVDCDVLDAPEALVDCVKQAAILWHITDQGET